MFAQRTNPICAWAIPALAMLATLWAPAPALAERDCDKTGRVYVRRVADTEEPELSDVPWGTHGFGGQPLGLSWEEITPKELMKMLRGAA